MQTTCGFECAIEHSKKTLKQQQLKVSRKKLKQFNNSDVSVMKRKAQEVCNKYIRLRDKDLPCISCGTTNDIQYHAGHYKPQGGFGYLRYNELNINKQCNVCNNHKSGNLVPYRENLIKKIGLKNVLILEKPNEIKKWELKELIEIIDTYKQKIKVLSLKD